MEQTKNYKLNKPSKTEHYNIQDFNENADIVDGALQELSARAENLENITKREDWKTANVNSEYFEPYSQGEQILYKKHAGIVQVHGCLRPTFSLKKALLGGEISSFDTVTMFTLPVGYRPVRNMQFLCQGSDFAQWLFSVGKDGNVSFSRYRTGEKATPLDAYEDSNHLGTWLPFDVVFLAEEV